jgi:hypothetical protein
MIGFTKLEEAILRDLCARFPDEQAALTAQLMTAKVRSRENTGVGFYTSFDVARADLAPLGGQRMRHASWVRVDGLDNPMGFILWLEGGFADCLEGFTNVDSTVGVDLTALTFEIEPPSN